VPKLALKADPEDEGKQIPYLQDRETLSQWAGKKIEKGELQNYQKEWNNESLDGLPGLRAARKDMGEAVWLGDMKASLKKNSHVWQLILTTFLSILSTIIVMQMLGYSTLKLRMSAWR
jgi:hypothetical protein